jgi:hypothetical protein
LPEILAGSGATAAVQAVNHGCGDAARFEDQSRHGRGERSAFADCSLHCRAVVTNTAPWIERHSVIRSAP